MNEPWSDNYSNSNTRQQTEPLSTYVSKTFGWMFLGLLFTFIVAFVGYTSDLILLVFRIPAFEIVLLVLEVGVVVFLSARIHKMSVGMARTLFFVYALLNGIVFSAYFVLFQMGSLVLVFALTSLYFGGMAAFGYFTKSDLTKYGSILFGGLVFLAIFWVLSMFINLSAFDTIVCFIGFAIFLVLTAYDTQKIKTNHQLYANNPEMAKKASIFSALQLYLDFINLFVYILRIIGRRNN